MGLTETEHEKHKRAILDKECLCVGLSNAAALNYNETFLKNMKSVNVCPGPNIVNFSEIVSLQKMIDHIYGRANIIKNKNRRHLFLAEFKIYINFFKEKLDENSTDLNNSKTQNYLNTFINNLFSAIEYYRKLNLTMNNPTFFDELLQFEKEIINFKNKLLIGMK